MMTLTTKSTAELVRLDAGIANWMSRAARQHDTVTMRTLLGNRKAVRAELESRHTAN
jgi:hypothetical protein